MTLLAHCRQIGTGPVPANRTGPVLACTEAWNWPSSYSPYSSGTKPLLAQYGADTNCHNQNSTKPALNGENYVSVPPFVIFLFSTINVEFFLYSTKSNYPKLFYGLSNTVFLCQCIFILLSVNNALG